MYPQLEDVFSLDSAPICVSLITPVLYLFTYDFLPWCAAVYLQLVRCRCAYDEASQEDNKDTIDDEIQVVEVTTKAVPFMPEQRSH